MSCIVAISQSGRIYMGADSCGSWCDEQRNRKDSKIFIKGDFLIGYVGSPRPGQVLQNYWKPPEETRFFGDSIRSVLSEHGCISMTEEQTEIMQMTTIIGYKGEFFEVMSDFQTCSYSDNYSAIGAGRPYALGSLFETNIMRERILTFDKHYEERMGNIERVCNALKCSEYLCIGVRQPFHVFSNIEQHSNEYKKVVIRDE